MKVIVVGAAAVIAAGTAVVFSAADGAGGPDGTGRPTGASTLSSTQDPREVQQYWTDERRRAAGGMPMLGRP